MRRGSPASPPRPSPVTHVPIIQIHELDKSYGSQPVLEGVQFEVEPGKRVGFLGPNGAGKTTTLRILMGLLKADRGRVRVLGMDCWQHGWQVRRDIGYLPGEVQFYPHLSGAQTLDFLARARGRDCRAEIRRLAEVLGLDLSRRVRHYSAGMKQKLGLIQALMHRARLLILDEPTTALDPLVRERLFAELKEVTREGRTLLFSSHSLEEVELLCQDVIIIRAGKIVEQAAIEDLRKRAGRHVDLVFAREVGSLPSALQVVHRDGRKLRGIWTGDTDTLLRWLAGERMEEAIIERPDLTDLFKTYYRESPAAGAHDV